ncbi:MAG: phosphoribosyltransferase family protein, partial [Gammaproteobacteria bacterium]
MNSYFPPGKELFNSHEVRAAIEAQAHDLAPQLAGRNPLVLVLMQGALYYAVWLTVALRLPLEIDYIHATRYGEKRSGEPLRWIRPPPAAVVGRTVLLVDDIFDEGVTLAAAKTACLAAGAAEVLIAVLALKRHDRAQAAPPDSVALEVPDGFVVGCGLD